MAEQKSCAGMIGNQGPMELKALHSVKPAGKAKVIRGKDLRSGN